MHPHQVQKLLLVLLICSQIDFVVGSFLDSDPYERAQVISIVVNIIGIIIVFILSPSSQKQTLMRATRVSLATIGTPRWLIWGLATRFELLRL